MFCVSASATQPVRINYQAKLTGAGGSALESTHTLFFSIWRGAAGVGPSPGTQVFGEQAALNVSNGVVNHTVGTGTVLFGGPLTDAAFVTNEPMFLQVAVDANLPQNVVLPPTRLESVPFAVRALNSDVADSALNGTPAGYAIVGNTATAPAGFSRTGAIFGSWQTRPPMPVAMSQLAAASAAGKVYAIGAVGSTPYNLVFNPAASSWGSLATPDNRVGLCCAQVDGLIYAIGGRSAGVAVATNQVYNPGTNAWAPAQAMSVGRSFAAAAVSDGKIYVFGGSDSALNSLGSTEAYSPVSNSWTPLAPMLAVRQGAGAATVNGKIYVIGGLIGASPTYTGANEEYDPGSNTWTSKSPMPIARHNLGVVGMGGKVYAFGGSSGGEISQDTYVYDPASDTWTQGAALATVRHSFAACVVNERIYALGGGDSIFSTGSTRNEELGWGMHYLHTKD
ncbi:MAG: Kelch repeat-containing protein [Candidatus Sumerlaeaceae bacterium]